LLARLTAYRLKCQDEWKHAGLDHTRLGVFQKYPFTEKQDRISRKYQLIKTFKTSIPTKDDWKRPDFLTDPNLEFWFTDESNVNDRFGAGLYGLGQTTEKIFLWESHGLLRRGVGYSLMHGKPHRKRETTTVFTSARTINALTKTITELSVVRDCMQALNRLGDLNKITLTWIPSHQASSAMRSWTSWRSWTQENPVSRIISIPFASGRKVIKSWLEALELLKGSQTADKIPPT